MPWSSNATLLARSTTAPTACGRSTSPAGASARSGTSRRPRPPRGGGLRAVGVAGVGPRAGDRPARDDDPRSARARCSGSWTPTSSSTTSRCSRTRRPTTPSAPSAASTWSPTTPTARAATASPGRRPAVGRRQRPHLPLRLPSSARSSGSSAASRYRPPRRGHPATGRAGPAPALEALLSPAERRALVRRSTPLPGGALPDRPHGPALSLATRLRKPAADLVPATNPRQERSGLGVGPQVGIARALGILPLPAAVALCRRAPRAGAGRATRGTAAT